MCKFCDGQWALTDKQFQALREEFVEAYKTATVIELKGE